MTPRTHDDNAELRRRLHDAEEKLVESDLKCSNLSLELGEMKLKLGNAEPADLEHMEMQDLKGRCVNHCCMSSIGLAGLTHCQSSNIGRAIGGKRA